MRRVTLGLLPLLVAGCAGAQTEPQTGRTIGSCETTDCFFERDVRGFDVIDRNTVVVYVGAQRCPFLVELRDTTCELRLTPAIEFFQTALGNMDRLTTVQSGRICSSTRGLVLYSGIIAPELMRQRESLETTAGVRRPDVRAGGGFGRSGVFDGSFPVDPMSDDVCRVTDIRSITDDQLIELYAETDAPPPPVGDGSIEIPDASEEALERAAEEAQVPETGAGGGREESPSAETEGEE